MRLSGMHVGLATSLVETVRANGLLGCWFVSVASEDDDWPGCGSRSRAHWAAVCHGPDVRAGRVIVTLGWTWATIERLWDEREGALGGVLCRRRLPVPKRLSRRTVQQRSRPQCCKHHRSFITQLLSAPPPSIMSSRFLSLREFTQIQNRILNHKLFKLILS
ncbi:hypothetical protein B0H12DRAFT_447662 [Mycena haematopus]|nr:hypothetical protein B0H12DRAFT_447662 [Mycena haematopus]